MKFSSLLAILAAACLLGTHATTSHAQSAPTQEYTASINGATIAYTITGGGGDTVLLIHGYPLNGNLFEKQREALSGSYRVITVDLRGFGDSVAPDSNASIQIYANDVLALMDQLGISQAIIGGHSMGGAVTVQLYQMAPTRFLGMILNDAAVMPPPVAEQYMWLGFVEQAPMTQASGLLPLLVPNFLTGATRTTRPGLVQKVSQQIDAASLNGLIGGAHALQTRPDYSALFAQIAVPVLLLYGQEDTLTPVEQAMMLHTLLPQSKLVIVAGASHAVVREQPGAANTAILHWLGKHFGAGGTTQAAAADNARTEIVTPTND